MNPNQALWDTFTFRSPSTPSAFVADFKNYYGPTMTAFAAAEQNGKSTDLQRELERSSSAKTGARPKARRPSLRPS
jgi:hypothetical protein